MDVGQLCRLLLAGHTIHRIRYFTAIVEARPGDPQQQQRQQIYLRALRTIPNLTIHLGTFQTNAVRLPLARPPGTGSRTVEVLRTEEKGSDVNLATYLLLDGFKGDYEAAVVLSNDSDLREPIRAVRRELDIPVGVMIPGGATWSALPADFYRRIRSGALAASQFPETFRDATGTITRPRAW